MHNIVGIFHSTQNSGNPKEAILNGREQESSKQNCKLGLHGKEIMKKVYGM